MISAQRGQHNFLCASRGLSRILHQFGGFGPAYPVSSLHRLQAHLQAQLAHFASNILDGGLGLRRSYRARPDIFSQMRDLPVGVVVTQRSVADGRKFLLQSRRQGRLGRSLWPFVAGIGTGPWFLRLRRSGHQDRNHQAAHTSHVDQESTSFCFLEQVYRCMNAPALSEADDTVATALNPFNFTWFRRAVGNPAASAWRYRRVSLPVRRTATLDSQRSAVWDQAGLRC